MELLWSFFQAGHFLMRERPDICFLFGGYVSLIPLLWCRLLGVCAVAHEQNAGAGKVTRLAARLGVPIASGWNECRGVRAFTPVGIPVRPLKRISRKEAASALEVDVEDGDFVMGVIGGSLSSASLSALIEKISENSADAGGNGIDFIEKNGENGEKIIFVVLSDTPAASFGKGVFFVGRRWDMDPFYSLCDAVVCRAGASTLAEIAIYGIPALPVPWSLAADGHQEANARCFAALTGSAVWKEDENAGAGEKILKETFLEFVTRARGTRGEAGCKSEPTAASSALWRFGQRECGILCEPCERS
jgi:UDP-N-acetylglucosamine--N-acetylmuramyl-(pentapeptide) pyrophosphoryl-undecaprenol N-acetylglucosamine transferase